MRHIKNNFSKRIKLSISLIGLTALALTFVLTVEHELLSSSLINSPKEERACDFKMSIFQQWAYIFGKDNSCVFR